MIRCHGEEGTGRPSGTCSCGLRGCVGLSSGVGRGVRERGGREGEGRVGERAEAEGHGKVGVRREEGEGEGTVYMYMYV